MSTTCSDVPDLLRRFLPLPHRTKVRIADIEIVAQSNDADVIAALQRAEASGNIERSTNSLHVSVIRDHDAPCEVSEIRIISAPPLETLLVGTGSFLILDCERREILGFLAPSISAQTFADELLPRLLEVALHMTASGKRSGGHS